MLLAIGAGTVASLALGAALDARKSVLESAASATIIALVMFLMRHREPR